MGNLSNWSFYQVGPIDLDKDPHSWRDKVTEFLIPYGAKVLDPTKKSSSIGLEDEDSRLLRKSYKENGEFNKILKGIKIESKQHYLSESVHRNKSRKIIFTDRIFGFV